MMNLFSCHYSMDTNWWKPGSRMAPPLPSTASPLRMNTATPRHNGQNWTGYSTISRWSTPSLCWVVRLNTTFHLAATMADWKIEPQKTRGKTANRAARVFIADFYSGNIARVHSSVRFHFSKIQSYYSSFLQVLTFTSHLPTHEECTPVRFLFAVCSRDCAFSAQIQRKPYQVSVFSA